MALSAIGWLESLDRLRIPTLIVWGGVVVVRVVIWHCTLITLDVRTV